MWPARRIPDRFADPSTDDARDAARRTTRPRVSRGDRRIGGSDDIERRADIARGVSDDGECVDRDDCYVVEPDVIEPDDVERSVECDADNDAHTERARDVERIADAAAVIQRADAVDCVVEPERIADAERVADASDEIELSVPDTAAFIASDTLAE